MTLSEKKHRKPARRPAQDSPMDVGLLQRLVSLMADNDLNTVDLRDGARRIVLKRGVPQGMAPVVHSAIAPPQPPPGTQPAIAPSVPEETKLIPVKSPMVGTYYAAPAPDAKPFVSVGTAVDEETDVCIIEAMKVFNNIKAECHGAIAKILVENGQPVEFGQVLFLVKPA